MTHKHSSRLLVSDYTVNELRAPFNTFFVSFNICFGFDDDIAMETCCTYFRQGLKKCASCQAFFYCDKTCQSLDWRLHHKFNECKYYKNANERNIIKNLTTIDRFILRLFLKLSIVDTSLSSKEFVVPANTSMFDKPRTVTDAQSTDTTRSFDSLMDHKQNVLKDVNRMDVIESMLELFKLIGVEDDFGEINLRDVVISLFGKVVINGFELGVESNGIGSGFYVQAAVFDHSCDPNSAIVFDNSNHHRCQVRAIKYIGVDDEIFISYISLRLPRDIRMKTLKSNYYFECVCPKCSDARYFDYDQLVIKTDELMAEYGMLNDGDPNELNILLQVYPLQLQMYNQGYHPDFTIEIMRILKAMKYNHSKFVGSKEKRKEKEREYKKFWNKMIQHVTVTHGLDHSFYTGFLESFR